MLWGFRVLTRTLGSTLANNHFHLIGGQSGPVNYRRRVGFDGGKWTQTFGIRSVERSGSDLATVVRVGVGRVQST